MIFLSLPATRGRNRNDFINNRQILGYPTPFEAVPIERRYNGERLFIELPNSLRASDIKWLSIWCEIFGISFGEVRFPNNLFN